MRITDMTSIPKLLNSLKNIQTKKGENTMLLKQVIINVISSSSSSSSNI